MLKRYRYRAYPTPAQQMMLARTFGCARVVYNDALAARETARRAGEPYPKGGELSKRLITDAKRTPERVWLGEVSAVALQQALADADRAYRNFFDSLAGRRKGKRVGFPRFKSRRDRRQSARFTRNARFKIRVLRPGRAEVSLPKIGDVRLAWSRNLPSDPSSVTVTREADGRYYVSFVVDVSAVPLPPVDRVAGVDVGLTDLATVVASDGNREKVANPRFLRRKQRALAHAQRSLSRKQKGSRNREKARRRVAVLHRKVRETRLDHAHKLALGLVRENQAVGVEGLCVKGLARTRMAKSVHDASWGQLIRLLHEKAAAHARTVVVVDRWQPTSQTCSTCGVKDGKKSLSVRMWTCVCGAVLDRDYNAAVNILVAAGLAETVNACGPDVRLALASAVGVEAGTHRTDVAA